MKAIGYIRVSTEEQAKDLISLDMQRAKIAAYASLEDLDLIDTIADEGISGCSIKGRPGIQKVLEMVKSKQTKAVIVYKLDRLAQNTIEALQVSRLLDRNGVALHSITEKLDTKSAMGRFFFTIMASIAEMERGIIGERIQGAMARKRQLGEACNNNPPYGFRIVDFMVVPDQSEQNTIKRIHEHKDQGRTIWETVDILTTESRLNRKGKPFGKTQIHNILRQQPLNGGVDTVSENGTTPLVAARISPST